MNGHRESQGKLARWCRQFLLFVIAVIATFASLEIGFRVGRSQEIALDRLEWEPSAGGKQPLTIYKKTREYEFSTKTNSWGFRNREISPQKPPGIKRILILGDSFTFGWGVSDEEMFTELLDRELNKHGKKFELINASGRSLSPLIYYVRLKNIYLKLQPDVVLVFFNHSDLREDRLYQENIVRDSAGALIDHNPLYVNGKVDFWRWARSKSEFLSYTYNKLGRTFAKISEQGFWAYLRSKFYEKPKRDSMTAENNRVPELNQAGFYYIIQNALSVAATRNRLAESTRYLSLIQTLLKEKRTPLVLVLLPSGIQVGPHQWSKGREFYGFETGTVYDNPAIAETIASFAKSREIKFVNLLPAFRNADPEPLYFEQDGHLRPAGHRAVARGLLSSNDFRDALNLP